jgi:hypothetical protein
MSSRSSEKKGKGLANDMENQQAEVRDVALIRLVFSEAKKRHIERETFKTRVEREEPLGSSECRWVLQEAFQDIATAMKRCLIAEKAIETMKGDSHRDLLMLEPQKPQKAIDMVKCDKHIDILTSESPKPKAPESTKARFSSIKFAETGDMILRMTLDPSGDLLSDTKWNMLYQSVKTPQGSSHRKLKHGKTHSVQPDTPSRGEGLKCSKTLREALKYSKAVTLPSMQI